jgi:hypothetical protein
VALAGCKLAKPLTPEVVTEVGTGPEAEAVWAVVLGATYSVDALRETGSVVRKHGFIRIEVPKIVVVAMLTLPLSALVGQSLNKLTTTVRNDV